MVVVDEMGDYFAALRMRAIQAEGYCSGIPILGGALRSFFDFAGNLFWDIRNALYRFSDWLDEVNSRMGEFLNWSAIEEKIKWSWDLAVHFGETLWWGFYEKVRATWTWLDDVRGYTWEYAYTKIKETWGWVEDITGLIRETAWDEVTTKVAWLKDLPGGIGQVIWDWLDAHLFSWLRERAEEVAQLATEILEVVW